MTKLYDPEAAASDAPVVKGATPEEVQMARLTGHVCGECRHFSRAEGQRLIESQKFVQQLVREHHWQTHHLCSPLNDLGICGQQVSGAPGENHTITGSMHKACDAFRPRNGLVSISRKTTDP